MPGLDSNWNLSRSLIDFKENTANYLRQLKETGEPVLLTVDDKAELVVQDAAAYQKLLDLVEAARASEAIWQGLADRDAGRTIDLDEFKEHAWRTQGMS